MSWFKKAQKTNITINDIIWAIDEIILKEGLFTVEDLMNAERQLGYTSQEVAKAAQTTTKKLQKGRSQTRRTTPLPSSTIQDLIEKGYKEPSISQMTGISLDEVKKIVKQRFPKVKNRTEYLKKHLNPKITDTTQDLHSKTMEDLSISKISTKRISEELGGVSEKYIAILLKANNMDIVKLVEERRNYISELIVNMVRTMENPYALKNIQIKFKKEYNHSISSSSLNRILKYNNIVTSYTQTSAALIFTAFKVFLSSRGIEVHEIPNHPPEKITKILDQFITNYGPEYGFKRPMDQIKLKQLFMTKIQLRDRAIEQGKNRLWFKNVDIPFPVRKNISNLIDNGETVENIIQKLPEYDPNVIKQFYHAYQLQRGPVITDQNHPSYFTAENKMNWYKKARNFMS